MTANSNPAGARAGSRKSDGVDRREYGRLLGRSLPRVIRTEHENERCLRLLEELDARSDRLTTAERELADLLTLLIENFEERRYALKPAAPLQTLRELMRANSLQQKDLLDVFSTPSIASEVLNGKRSLTVDHIRKLSRRFHISPELLL